MIPKIVKGALTSIEKYIKAVAGSKEEKEKKLTKHPDNKKE